MSAATPTAYIPTLEGGDRLAACLEAVASQTVETEIVVVDNGPGAGSSELLAARFPHVGRISFEGRNMGFGAALNRAVAARGEGPLVFLNDDAFPAPDFVEKLLAARDESGAAMVAGVLLKASNPELIDSAGIRCDRTLTAWDFLTGETVDQLESARDPLGPTGGGALFDRQAFEGVGGFDEHIFLYYEDLDLALRMRLAGHACRLAGEARAIHESSATLGRRSAAKYLQTGFSRGYLLRKYGIMRHPALALKVLVSDGSAGLAQVIADKTAAGLSGRWHGWRAGRYCEQTEGFLSYLDQAKFRQQMRVRLARRRY